MLMIFNQKSMPNKVLRKSSLDRVGSNNSQNSSHHSNVKKQQSLLISSTVKLQQKLAPKVADQRNNSMNLL